MIILFIFMVALAYLLASVSSAVLISKLMGLPDPRTEGSGNPGATNVNRLGGVQAGLYVFIADALKGFVPVLIAKVLGFGGMGLGLIALAAVAGHIFSVFMNFKGGKGVATAVGTIMAISFPLAVIALLTWIAVVAITRYVSLGSIIAILVVLVLSPFVIGLAYFIPLFIISGLILWRHQENIERLRAGAENKINWNN